MSDFAVKISNTESTAQTVTMFGIATSAKSTPSTPGTGFIKGFGPDTGMDEIFGYTSIGQTWLQDYTGTLESIMILFSSDISNTYNGYILTIKNHDTGSVIASYTGLSGTASTQCTYVVNESLTAGVYYSFEISRADAGNLGLYRLLTTYYPGSNVLLNGIEVPTHMTLVFYVRGTYGGGSGTPEPTPENTGPSYTALVQSLRQDPQYYNMIRIDSTNSVQRQKMMKVITRDILNLVTEESTVNAFDFITTKDFNNQTILYFKQPVLIGVDSFEYEIEPNTEVTMLFSYQKPEERQTVGKQITNMYENVKQKIVKGEYIAEFKGKDILKQIKIITTTIGTISLLVYLIRRIK